jgi:hypothetical protein
MNSRTVWTEIVQDVAAVVSAMPLWKLQTIGSAQLDFLYENTGKRSVIELRPGVAYCFRKFHALITDLVRERWGRFVRRQNLSVLGEIADLNEFLFGSERANLTAARPVLMEVQSGDCFYCRAPLTDANSHVDHFVAWARYPVDLGHNFVLAHASCNGKKRDRLPAYDHLVSWIERNARFGDQIATALKERGMLSGLAASTRVAEWAYSQVESAGGLTWVRADEMVPLMAGWRSLLPAE